MTRHWSQRSSRRRGTCDTLERIGGQPSTQTLQRLYKMCEQETKTSMTRGGGDITYLITALIERPKFKMIGIWSKDVPDLRLRVHQFDVLFETRLPILRKYLMSVGMVPDCYASQWFCTIFAYVVLSRAYRSSLHHFISLTLPSKTIEQHTLKKKKKKKTGTHFLSELCREYGTSSWSRVGKHCSESDSHCSRSIETQSWDSDFKKCHNTFVVVLVSEVQYESRILLFDANESTRFALKYFELRRKYPFPSICFAKPRSPFEPDVSVKRSRGIKNRTRQDVFISDRHQEYQREIVRAVTQILIKRCQNV